MLGIGLGELILIVIIALIFISPDKLPEAAEMLAKAIREIRKAGNEFNRGLTESDMVKKELTEIKTGLSDAVRLDAGPASEALKDAKDKNPPEGPNSVKTS